MSEKNKPLDNILSERVTRLERMQLRGSEVVKEVSNIITEWDPRVVSISVRSLPDWRDWIAADQQQQQQQQQQQ
jgi:hypothetical protein